MEGYHYFLMALEPLTDSDWLKVTESNLSRPGFSVRRNRYSLLIWKEQQQIGNLIFSDASLLRRIWLSPNRSALGIFAKRIYFENSGSSIDNRPEYLILGTGKIPPTPLTSDTFRMQWEIIRALQSTSDTPPLPVALNPVDFDVETAETIYIGRNRHLSPRGNLNDLYCQFGFDQVPTNFTVTICPLESVSDQTIAHFSRGLKQAASTRHVGLRIIKASSKSILLRLAELTESGNGARKETCLFFILPHKKQPPKSETLAMFQRLRQARIPFRRAYADDPIQYSIPDQFSSLLTASGGCPHRAPTILDRVPLWTIGIDLSHKKNSPISRLVLTLVNPEGALVDAWMTSQPRDETVSSKSIRVLLNACAKKNLKLRQECAGRRAPRWSDVQTRKQ